MVKKVTHQFNGILMDSQEEVWFAMWCQELQDRGFISHWEKVTISMELTPEASISYTKETKLKTKVKREEKKHIILRKLEYTPDFRITWTGRAISRFAIDTDTVFYDRDVPLYYDKYSVPVSSFVEVKPKFDQNNMTRDFITKQKFIYFYQNIFVNLVHPEDLFQRTFMPKLAMSDFRYKNDSNKWKKGDWKTKYTPKTFEEYEQSI